MAADGPIGFDPIAEAVRNWQRAGWDDAADGMALVTSIMRAHQLMLAKVDAVLAPFGLTFSRFEVLMLLDFSRKGHLPLSKIGQRLQVHAASVTNAVDRLQDHGLVERVPHPTDGRTTLAVVTTAGRRLTRRAAKELNSEVFGRPGIAPGQVDSLLSGLAALRRSAGDFVEVSSASSEPEG